LKPDALPDQTPQPNTQTQPGIHLETVCRSLLRIVAHFNETLYTEASSTENERQAEVYQHPDLSDPASDDDTSQG
jgi:hypothetical protein